MSGGGRADDQVGLVGPTCHVADKYLRPDPSTQHRPSSLPRVPEERRYRLGSIAVLSAVQRLSGELLEFPTQKSAATIVALAVRAKLLRRRQVHNLSGPRATPGRPTPVTSWRAIAPRTSTAAWSGPPLRRFVRRRHRQRLRRRGAGVWPVPARRSPIPPRVRRWMLTVEALLDGAELPAGVVVPAVVEHRRCRFEHVAQRPRATAARVGVRAGRGVPRRAHGVELAPVVPRSLRDSRRPPPGNAAPAHDTVQATFLPSKRANRILGEVLAPLFTMDTITPPEIPPTPWKATGRSLMLPTCRRALASGAGPLAIFHRTFLYGNALARLPAESA